MAVTRLSDVIVSKLWTPTFILEDTNLRAFFNSGIVVLDPQVDAYAKSDANVITLKHLKPIDTTDPENLSSDDPTQLAVPSGASTGYQNMVKVQRNKSWASMDLVAAFFDPDPIKYLRSQVATYWLGRFEAYIIAVCAGITAANVAQNGGDMVYDATGNTGDAAFISGDAILLAKQTMGDHAKSLRIIVLHSILYTSLQRQQLIVYLRDADADINIPTYLGYRIIVDDNSPVAGNSTDGFVYTSYMFAPGFIRWGNGEPKTPTAIQRVEAAGNGEGEETFHSRMHWAGHPLGFSYKLDPTIPAGANPSNATLAQAATWARVFPRKLVPFVAIKTKG